MKNIRRLFTVAMLSMSIAGIEAQIPGIDFIYGNISDTRLLLQEYMRPYANVMGANLNAGWYNTAKPHKLGGFDITATFSVAFAPTNMLTYDLKDITGLNASYDMNNSTAPTVAGKMESLPELQFSESVYNPVTDLTESYSYSVKHPNGTGVKFLPMPMAQASLGLFKGTDVTIRYVPDLRIGQFGDIGLFGIGGRHSVSQWIPVLNKLDFINIAVQGGYTKVHTSAHLNMQPQAEIDIPNPPNFDDQFLNMNISGWTINLIASQSIPVITVYEGIGYSNSMVDLALAGKFPITTIYTEPDADFGKTTYTVVEDPIETLEFENNRNLRLNAGIRFKLGVLTIHYDFTKTLYATHTAGIGISFR